MRFLLSHVRLLAIRRRRSAALWFLDLARLWVVPLLGLAGIAPLLNGRHSRVYVAVGFVVLACLMVQVVRIRVTADRVTVLRFWGIWPWWRRFEPTEVRAVGDENDDEPLNAIEFGHGDRAWTFHVRKPEAVVEWLDAERLRLGLAPAAVRNAENRDG
jgi:hypothetical protein